MAIAATAYYLHAQTTTESTTQYIAGMRLFMGLAMPFAWLPLMAVALMGIPPAQLASAAGIFNFSRMVASSAGTAMGITLWDHRSIYHRSRLAENISEDSVQYQEAMELLNQVTPSHGGALTALDMAVEVQARTLAMGDVFYVCMAIAALFIAFAVLLPARTQVGATEK